MLEASPGRGRTQNELATKHPRSRDRKNRFDVPVILVVDVRVNFNHTYGSHLHSKLVQNQPRRTLFHRFAEPHQPMREPSRVFSLMPWKAVWPVHHNELSVPMRKT